MNRKALVQVLATTVSPVHEPILEVALIHGTLTAGMEATWQGLKIIINTLQTVDGEEVQQYSLVGQTLHLIVDVSDQQIFSQLQGQRLTFWSDQSLPVVDIIQPWQTELSS